MFNLEQLAGGRKTMALAGSLFEITRCSSLNLQPSTLNRR